MDTSPEPPPVQEGVANEATTEDEHRADPTYDAADVTADGEADLFELLADDELVEVTPESIRLRKKILRQTDRPRRRHEKDDE